jgi:hypothetical protein
VSFSSIFFIVNLPVSYPLDTDEDVVTRSGQDVEMGNEVDSRNGEDVEMDNEEVDAGEQGKGLSSFQLTSFQLFPLFRHRHS